jgi:hypothetical protein
MPQTVNVTVTGLCLFAPGTDGRMYVLLPATGGAGDGSVEPHFPLMRFAPGTVESGPEVLDVGGLEVRFGAEEGEIDRSFARGVVNLRRYTGAGVPGHLFSGDGEGALAARVAFSSGAMRSSGMLSCWTLPRARDGASERVVLSNQAVWTITLPDGAGPLVIHGGPAGSGVDAPLVTLRHDVPTLDITLSHDVDHVHCHVPEIGSENEHFQAYRWLMEDSADWHLPRFAGEGACGAGGLFAHGGSPYTCMVGGVDLPPLPPPLP